jgi:hypothetical protein
MDPERLAAGYALNTRLIELQADGLSHEDSLVQTPYRINCLNWVLGHILDGRGRLLEVLGSSRIVPTERTERYRRESEPIVEDGPEVLRLEELIDGLRATGERIVEILESMERSDLDADVDDGEEPKPLGHVVFGRYFHDTYHTGQTDLLRQVAGVGDKVI